MRIRFRFPVLSAVVFLVCFAASLAFDAGPARLGVLGIALVALVNTFRVASRTLVKGDPGLVRIIGVPPGEAPEWVRQKWVGLKLPLAQAGGAPVEWRSGGVLTGPRNLASEAIARVTGRTRNRSGYIVEVLAAIEALERVSPEAAKWWRDNAPHMMTRSRCFVFSAEACELVADPPPGAAHFPAPPKE